MRDDAHFERAFVGEVWITFDQEAAILAAIKAPYGGPWRCAQCACGLTPETGWKPRLAYVGNDEGVYRAVIDALCGPCAKLFGNNGGMRPGFGTDGVEG